MEMRKVADAMPAVFSKFNSFEGIRGLIEGDNGALGFKALAENAAKAREAAEEQAKKKTAHLDYQWGQNAVKSSVRIQTEFGRGPTETQGKRVHRHQGPKLLWGPWKRGRE